MKETLSIHNASFRGQSCAARVMQTRTGRTETLTAQRSSCKSGLDSLNQLVTFLSCEDQVCCHNQTDQVYARHVFSNFLPGVRQTGCRGMNTNMHWIRIRPKTAHTHPSPSNHPFSNSRIRNSTCWHSERFRCIVHVGQENVSHKKSSPCQPNKLFACIAHLMCIQTLENFFTTLF